MAFSLNPFAAIRRLIADLQSQIVSIHTDIGQIHLEVDNMKQSVRELRQQMDRDIGELRDRARFKPDDSSPIPWVEVCSEEYDPVKGVKLQLDWNAAFVQYLRDNGLTGIDDDTIVQKWLSMVSTDLSSQLEDGVMERDGEHMPYAG